MEQPNTWTDPSTLVGGGGLLAIIAAAAKTVLDWRRDRGQQRQTGQDALIDDLMATVTAQSGQISTLYEMLGKMQGAVRECETRAVKFQGELGEQAVKFQGEIAKLHQENVGLRFRYHGLMSWLAAIPSLPDVPPYLTEPIEGPTQRDAQPKPPPEWSS